MVDMTNTLANHDVRISMFTGLCNQTNKKLNKAILERNKEVAELDGAIADIDSAFAEKIFKVEERIAEGKGQTDSLRHQFASEIRRLEVNMANKDQEIAELRAMVKSLVESRSVE